MRINMIGMFVTLGMLYASIAFGAEPTRGPMRPVAVCKDGKTYSNDTGLHRFACAGHGGVKEWTDGSPVKVKGPAHTKYE